MTPDIRDIVILGLIVLNIIQIYLTKGHIPPELVDKLFEFAAAKAAQTPDPTDDKTVDELWKIATTLLNAQPPVDPAKTVMPDTAQDWRTMERANIGKGGTVLLSDSSTSISTTPVASTTTTSYTAAQDFDSPVMP